jgi:hypothetical protein
VLRPYPGYAENLGTPPAAAKRSVPNLVSWLASKPNPVNMLVNLLLIAGALLLATLYGFYRLQRHMKGGGSDGASIGGKKKDDGDANVDLEQFIAVYRQNKGKVEVPAAAPAGPPGPAAPPSLKPKEGFLSGPNKLLYLVLRAALPDHQIFANVRLSDSVQLAGEPATPHARAQLAQARIDFLVCNKALAIVAYIDISDGNRADDVLKRQIERFLNSSGVRYLRVPPTAIPRPAELRALIYSE